MKRLVTFGLLAIISTGVLAQDQQAAFFQRPLNCPLRPSSLSGLRDQIQVLVSTLRGGCDQQALNQLSSSIGNLENIASTWQNYNAADEQQNNAQFAKSLNQVLSGLNIITANNSCLYDIRSRGFLPVVSDVIMSISQFGLLVPHTTGMYAAAGGYVVGSGIKIIHQLFKKKFNFNRPEERRAFLQLNCAFFDNRRQMEEAGIFALENESYQDLLITELRKERADLIRTRQKNESRNGQLESQLEQTLNSVTEIRERGLGPSLTKKLSELGTALASRPADYAEKWRQVNTISLLAEELLADLSEVQIDHKTARMIDLLSSNLEKMLPDLAKGAKAWSVSIDDYEMHFRGPLMAFIIPVHDAVKAEAERIEANLAISDAKLSKAISHLRGEIKTQNTIDALTNQRLISLESKIYHLEQKARYGLFSEDDESTSNAVEILDYYKTLQNSILGKEGRGYLEHALKSSIEIRNSLAQQVKAYHQALGAREKCSAAEKVRFAWAQYRYKVQEAHDFVATNFDIYRSSFGKKLKKSTTYVLNQIGSVEDYQNGQMPYQHTVGDLMRDVEDQLKSVEEMLQQSGCF